jgi:hypothetical protein
MGPEFSSIWALDSPLFISFLHGDRWRPQKKKRRQMAEGKRKWMQGRFQFSWQNLEINAFKIIHLSMTT